MLLYLNGNIPQSKQENKEKKKSQADLTYSGNEEALLLGERRSPPALSFQQLLISTGLLPLSLSAMFVLPLSLFYFL